MSEKFATLGTSTLNGSILSGATSMVLTSASTFSTSGTFSVRVDDEIFLVSSVSGNTLTAVGAQEGTIAAGHSSGATVAQIVTARSFTQLKTDILALSGLLLPLPARTSVTNTTTLTSAHYNTAIVCSGTTFNYTVTMPSATVAPVGTLIMIGMSSGLTKLVTLASSSGTQMDGATSRQMWANENAMLYCDGTQWRKLFGKAVPMCAILRLSANQPSIPIATDTTVLLDQSDIDNTGMMVDTTNACINIIRASNYDVRGNIQCDGASLTGVATRWIGTLNRDPATGTYAGIMQNELTAQVGSYTSAVPEVGGFPLGLNYRLQISVYQDSGVNPSLYGNTFGAATQLCVSEIPSW